MTSDPGTGGASGTGVVRPLRARLVQQDRAAEKVFPMLDALPASERTSLPDAPSGPSRLITPEGYDDAGVGLYVYRLRRGDDEHVGLVGDVSVQAFVDGSVRGHEEVQPDRVEALVEHFSSVAVRSELVALLHRPGPVAAAALAECVEADPLLQFFGPEGWEQTVWKVPAPSTADLVEELGAAVHYVADGHHRVAASLGVWRQAGEPAGSGVMCVMYPLDGLRLLAFHRRVLGPVAAQQLFDVLAGTFELTHLSDPGKAAGCFALYVGGRWYDALFTGKRDEGAAGLDVAILDRHVLEPLLGSSAKDRLQIASALSPLRDLTDACDEDGGALFALRPPALEQLTEVADRGEVMPPKTTYFDPKPFAGIFLS